MPCIDQNRVGALLVGAIALSMLQPFHSLPWQGWHSEIIVFVACTIAFLCVIALSPIRVESEFQVPAGVLAPLGIGLIAMIQGVAGQIEFFGDVLVIVGYCVICAQAMAIGFELSKPLGASQPTLRNCPANGLPRQMAIGVLFAAVVSVFISLTQTFDTTLSATWLLEHNDHRRPGANLGQPNQFATLVLMGLVSLVHLRETNSIRPMTMAVIGVLLCLGLAISESRAGMLGATVLALWWSARPNRHFSASKVWVCWAVLMAVTLLWPGFITYVFLGGEAALDPAIGVTRTPSLRFRIWPQLIEATLMHPWFGWGLRGVSVAHNAVLDHFTQGEPYTYAHNVLLELTIGVGIPGGVLIFALTCVWWLRRARKALTPECQFCVALCIPFACHSLVEYPFAYAYFLVPIMLAVGLLEGTLLPKNVLKVPIEWIQTLSCLTILVVFWTIYEYVQIEDDFRVARMQALRIGKTPPEHVVPSVHLLTQLDAMLIATRTNPAPDMRPEQIEILRVAAMRFPWTAIQNRYALALALNGNPSEAARQLRVMRAMFGQSFYIGIRQSWIELANTKYPQLEKVEIP